jgi:formylglycine-generating enzyme required for sulfatase activity
MKRKRQPARWSSNTLLALVFACKSAPPQEPAPAPGAPLEPAGPPISGWEVTEGGGVCVHPAVTADCQGGWCKIPAGCFIMGSPETEFMRGLYTEIPTAVTLTHAFEMAQYETTQEQWLEIAGVNPARPDAELADCTERNCPVTHMTWFEALEYANQRSERHEPPLPRCYALDNCQGALGQGLACEAVALTTDTPYVCQGFRLPTEAEWEYAARAGTRTAYYSGDVTVEDDNQPEPNLEPIAWYTKNAGQRTHPVGLKAPNRWLLYDMLGNVYEWTSDYPIFHDPPGPLTDPMVWETTGNPQTWRVIKGGRADMWPSALRAASRDYPDWEVGGMGYGFRLVRTL